MIFLMLQKPFSSITVRVNNKLIKKLKKAHLKEQWLEAYELDNVTVKI